MGEGKYREEKALERGFLLLAVLVMGAWILALWLSFRSERNRILDVLTTLYGRTDAARFSALLDDLSGLISYRHFLPAGQ